MKEERLFEENEIINLKKVEEIINFEVKDDIDNNEVDVDKEKWLIYPAVYLEKEEVRTKIIEFVRYVDGLSDTRLNKISLILNVVYLVEKLKFDILNIDVNNLYLLVNYVGNENIDGLADKLNIINDKEMLYQIRLFSLDMKVRGQLLSYILKNGISKEDFMKMISEKTYYEVLDIIK